MDSLHLNKFAVKKSVKYEDLRTVLLSLLDQLSGLTVKLFTDYQNVPHADRFRLAAASKVTLSIFNICCSRGISIEMEWIPRTQNDKADFLSRICDSDDWGLSWNTFQKHLIWFGVRILSIVLPIS